MYQSEKDWGLETVTNVHSAVEKEHKAVTKHKNEYKRNI